MFRLVLVHQLVLSLLVGPMLCCCAAARLGHEPSSAARAGGEPVRKHCCGEPRPDDSGRPAPGEKPGGPDKCPCKDAPQTAVAVPEAPVTTADALTLFASGLPALDESLAPGGSFAAGRPSAPFDDRSSTLSADDLLYAHHNLRC